MLPQHPFQKIAYPGKITDNLDLVVAASGPHVLVLNLLDGTILFKWPYDGTSTRSEEAATLGGADGPLRGEPPEKKQKLSTSQADGISVESSSSVEIETEKIKGRRRRRPKPEPSLPNISHLLATVDGKHLTVITAEDKCVRVFKISEQGQLETLSERCMPKRPCTIVLEPKGRDLLVADKFGDVYSLPLLPSKGFSGSQNNLRARKAVSSDPSASELTVHTKGNLEALRQQRLQRASGEPKPDKVMINFEHTLLLGHVSLLTDLQAAVLPSKVSTNTSNKARRYIITTDRDEHIRVSRGPPQSHIIEAYCHGHRHFVTKACVLPWQPEFLVAGSGTPSLYTYVWPEGRRLSQKNHLDDNRIISALSEARHEFHDRLQNNRYAVSGLWTMEYAPRGKSPKPFGFVFVAIEGLPIILVFIKTLERDLVFHKPIFLKANALDVITISSQRMLLVAVDGAHKPGSMKARYPSEAPNTPFMEAFTLQEQQQDGKGRQPNSTEEHGFSAEQFHWEESYLPEMINQTMKANGTVDVDVPFELDKKAIYSPLGEFLYGLENLRKKAVQESAEVGES